MTQAYVINQLAQIARLVAQGVNNQDIANKLQLRSDVIKRWIEENRVLFNHFLQRERASIRSKKQAVLQRRKAAPKRQSQKTKQLIIDAATLSARGFTIPEIEQKLSVNRKQIYRARIKYPLQWQSVFDAELQNNVAGRENPDEPAFLSALELSRKCSMRLKTRELISQVIPLIAQGKTFRETAVLLNSTVHRILFIKHTHREIWDGLLQAERKRIIESGAIDKTRERLPQEDMAKSPLLEFLHRVYAPSRLDLSHDVIYQFEIVIRQFNAVVGSISIGELTDDAVCRFLRDCMKRGLSPATVNSKRAMILALWRCAWRKSMIAELPRDVPSAKLKRRVPEAWTAEEIQRLVCYAELLDGEIGDLPKSWFWTTLVLVAFETGLRIGELLKTAVADIHLDYPAIVTRPENDKTGSAQFFGLTPTTAELLAEHLSPVRNDLVWPWPHCRRYFFTSFRKIVEGAGLHAGHKGNDLFHKLRRTHISHIARTSLEAARRAAGHTHATTTEKHYIDPRIVAAAPVVNLLPRVVPSCTRAITYDVSTE